MEDKPWWYRMMDLRSYKTVVLFFAKHFHSSQNFDAIIQTANKYKYANVMTVKKMLTDLGVIKHVDDEIEYDEDRLMELMEYMIHE